MEMEREMKPDQERVKTLLTDTVTLLCKNGLQFRHKLRVEGLLGVSIDDSDVFFVHISEFLNGTEKPAAGDSSDDLSFMPGSAAKRKRPNTDSLILSCHDEGHQSDASPRSVNIPSPAQEAKPARMHVKQELDEVIMIKEEEDEEDEEDEDVHPSRQMASLSESRVPPLHGIDPSYASAESALQNLQSNMTAQFQNMQALMRTDGDGQKLAKRRFISEGSEAIGGAVVPGMVRGIQDQNRSSQGSSSGAGNSLLASDLAAQFSDGGGGGGVLSLEPVPGSSGWPSSAALSGAPPNDQMLAPWLLEARHGRGGGGGGRSVSGSSVCLGGGGVGAGRRRSKFQVESPHHCSYSGCKRSFMHSRNLWRHEVLDHGRKTRKQLSQNCDSEGGEYCGDLNEDSAV